MFRANEEFDNIAIHENLVEIENISDVLTETGWCNVKSVEPGNYIELDEGWALVANKVINSKYTTLYLE